MSGTHAAEVRTSAREGKGVLLPRTGDKTQTRPLVVGSRVMARWKGMPKAARYPGVIVALLEGGRVRVRYDEACPDTGDQEEELPVHVQGRADPLIMHEDGTYVRAGKTVLGGSARDGDDVPRKEHLGFTRMMLAPQEDGDDLADRMQFPFRMAEQGEDGIMKKGPVQHVSLRGMINEEDKMVALAHHKALFDWFVQLYTTPPTSFEGMQHILGEEDVAGPWSPEERERVKEVFQVHALAKQKHDKKRRTTAAAAGNSSSGHKKRKQ